MIDKLLSEEKLDACQEAREWAKGKPWPEIYETCPRGDWLLWLFIRTNPDDVRLRVLIAGHCANTVRHLMTDPHSVAGVDASIAFGEGRIDEAELKKAARAASAAVSAAVESAVESAARAAVESAADAAWAAAWAAWAAWAAARAAARAAAWAARAENQRQTADIVRKYAPIEIWNVEEDTK